jgi:hypothetical protein
MKKPLKAGDRVRLKGFAMSEESGDAVCVDGDVVTLAAPIGECWHAHFVPNTGVTLKVTPSQCRRVISNRPRVWVLDVLRDTKKVVAIYEDGSPSTPPSSGEQRIAVVEVRSVKEHQAK